MASPLLISGNVRNMSNYLLETYKNKYVIAVSQDPLGVQGSRVAGGDLSGVRRPHSNFPPKTMPHGARFTPRGIASCLRVPPPCALLNVSHLLRGFRRAARVTRTCGRGPSLTTPSRLCS